MAKLGLSKFQEAQNERYRYERRWYLNLAFYGGRQWVKFKGEGKQAKLYTPPAPYYRPRPVINHVRRIVRKDISRLTQQKPNAYVIPASLDDQDVFAAQAGEAIWDSLWRKLKVNSIMRRVAFWQVTCGVGYTHQYWDDTLLAEIKREEDPETGAPVEHPIYGDICIKPVSPFHVLVPDLKEETLQGQSWMVHAISRPNTWIKQFYGIDPRENSGPHVISDSVHSALDMENAPQNNNSVVLEFWVKPGGLEEFPEGAMFTIAGDKIVQGFDQFPYSHGEFPFSKFEGIPTGKFYTESIVTDLVPLQRELNRTRGQIIEAKNKTSKPQLLGEDGAVDPAMITTEPGQYIGYRSGFNPPVYIQPPSLPGYVTEELNRTYSDMADLAGQHEVSQGSVPPGVTAAVAISYLQEQDEGILSTFYDSQEEALEDCARQCLTYVKDYWDEPRTVQITGTDSVFDVQTFRGSNLHNNRDIRVESGSSLPISRAAKQAYIMDLMNMGFIPPESGLEVLEIGGLNKIYERVQVDKRQAQRENLKMRVITEEDLQAHIQAWEEQPDEKKTDPETGKELEAPPLVTVNTWDNHEIHVAEHNNYRKSQAFEMLDPVAKQQFEEHVKMHQIAQAITTLGDPTKTGGSVPQEQAEEEGLPEQQEQQQMGEQEVEGQQQPGPEPIPEGMMM